MNATPKTYCKNCESELNGKFCNNCGQRTSVGKVTFKETFQDFMDMVFSVNAPLMLTLKMLIVNPGKLFREYLNGKRKKYYKPVAFFILSTVVYLILISILNYNPFSNLASAGDVSKDFDLLLNQANEFMAQNMNNFLFVFVFSFGILLKLFFYKRYSLIEYIAVSFYLVGVFTIIIVVFMPFLKFSYPESGYIPFVLMGCYLIFAIPSFFKNRILITILKTIFVYIISIIIYSIFSFLLSFFIIWLKNL